MAERSGTDSWRVVLFTNAPGGVIYQGISQILPALGHRLVGVVTSAGPARRRSTHYLDTVKMVPPEIDVIVSNHPSRWAAMLAPLEPDLIICGALPWRLPDDVLAMPRLGAINFHPSLLPRHRGPSPFEAMFRAGDAETGVTIHRMASGFDTGAILAQGRVPVSDDDDMGGVFAKLSEIAPGLIVQALTRVAKGEPGEPQDESLATYAGLLDDHDELIDWNQPAREIHNRVRSLSVFRDPCGGLAEIDGARVRVSRTRLLPPGSGGPPGAVLSRDGGRLIVQCADSPLAILEWTPA